ncbi:MAG: type II toxin-antitoxin system VapC family toxin [Verrucomicrobia bacterium]|nr:type II toxin-antitoxin system VapC family toxin [Verrucomicrobiota bacterium]
MKAYADTSFIVSLYLPEPDRTDRAVRYMGRHREALPFTPQHRLEVRNAIRLLVWGKRITTLDRSRAFREIEMDLDSQDFLIHAAFNYTEAYRRAEALGAAHNEKVGCRSADLFHVAAALELGLDEFVTFDEKQKVLARAAGLKVAI